MKTKNNSGCFFNFMDSFPIVKMLLGINPPKEDKGWVGAYVTDGNNHWLPSIEGLDGSHTNYEESKKFFSGEEDEE